MRRLIQVGLCAVFLGSAGAILYGCGSSNNDQGVSVTAIGYNGTDDEDVCDPEIFISGMSVPISGGTTTETLVNAGQPIYSCIELQNNMYTQFVRSERVFHEFYIEGASVQPPDSSAPLSIVLGPAGQSSSSSSGSSSSSSSSSTSSSTTSSSTSSGSGSATGTLRDPPTSDLPRGMTNANMVSAAFIAVPVEVMEWIGLNRTSLPEPPFTMSVTHYVRVVTSSGEVLNTNKLTMFVVITPDVIIPPEEAVSPDTTPTPTSSDVTEVTDTY